MEKTQTTCATATTTYVVPAGVTRYFDFNATVSGVEGATGVETISAQLEGDAAYPTIMTTDSTVNMFSAANVDSETTHDDFIWSPNSTTTNDTTAQLGNLDYTNGYFVPGLPLTNMTAEYFTSPN